MLLEFTVNGDQVQVEAGDSTLLEVLRDQLGLRSAKDGCSPQGQCGCCTVWVDGAPRVACVTPARRVAGRDVTTLEGLDPDTRNTWANAFCATGASQCGFCTPGIIMRLAAGRQAPDQALLAHLCRCTGWRSILDADALVAAGSAADANPVAEPRDFDAAERRAALEGGVPQKVGPQVALGEAGFADDLAPLDALVAVPDGAGDWVVAESVGEARAQAGKIQGRRTTLDLTWPVAVPDGEWVRTLQTTWTEPGYLETDASWCLPGGEPADPLANGGAFGAKTTSVVREAARQLADQHGRAVRVVLSREDTVLLGAKRPPVGAGVTADGAGVLRCAATADIERAVADWCPGLTVEQEQVSGPPTSALIRGAGWLEAAVLSSSVRGDPRIESPNGAWAEAGFEDGRLRIAISCGDPLDEVVLRSYCTGAAHQALGAVWSEGIAVGPDGVPNDLTIRSFGILRAIDTPEIELEIHSSRGAPVNGSDAVLVAVARAAWALEGFAPRWPTRVTPGARS